MDITGADPDIRPTPSRGCFPNILIKISGKPYEIIEILARGGGGRWKRSLRSATAL